MAEVEIEDAYQEHVRALREREDTVKIATLVMPAEDLASIWKVIASNVDGTKGLSSASKEKWESILRSLAKAVQEAE